MFDVEKEAVIYIASTSITALELKKKNSSVTYDLCDLRKDTQSLWASVFLAINWDNNSKSA